MQQHYQDATAICRALRSASIFTTFTGNPSWIEILRELLPGQTAKDQPDRTAWVFKLHLDDNLRDIRKRNTVGRAVGMVHEIEFQKRGLPHAHILIILDKSDLPRSTEDAHRLRKDFRAHH